MNATKKNLKRDVFYYCRCFLSTHKKRCLTAAAAVVACMILGIITSSGEGGQSLNYIILMRSNEGYNVFASFFKTILLFLPFYCVCLGLTVFPKIKFLGYAMLCFIGYRLGMKITVCITEDTWLGIIFITLNLIPVYLVFIITLTIAYCLAVEQAGVARKCNLACRNSVKTYGMKLGVIYLTACACQIVFLIIIPCVIKIFVVV